MFKDTHFEEEEEDLKNSARKTLLKLGGAGIFILALAFIGLVVADVTGAAIAAALGIGVTAAS